MTDQPMVNQQHRQNEQYRAPDSPASSSQDSSTSYDSPQKRKNGLRVVVGLVIFVAVVIAAFAVYNLLAPQVDTSNTVFYDRADEQSATPSVQESTQQQTESSDEGGRYFQVPEGAETTTDQAIDATDSGASASASENTGGASSHAAPDFTVTDEAGKTVSFDSLVGKGPIIVNFWASWCSICDSEMPEFQEAYEQYGDKIQFMMVNCTDGRETKETALRYIQQNHYDFPLYFDTSASATRAYNVSGIPVTVFINDQGEIIGKTTGALSQANLYRAIEQLLG